MISNYNYIFLDVDGVILDSIQYYLNLIRSVAEALGADPAIEEEFYRHRLGVKLEHWMPQIIPSENHDKMIPLFLMSNQDAVFDRDVFPLIEGTFEALGVLKKQEKKICLISAKRRAAMDVMLKSHELDGYVDFSVSGDDVRNYKPDPEGIMRAMDYFCAPPNKVVFIGDSLHDMGAAANAKIDFIGVTSGVCSEDDWWSCPH